MSDPELRMPISRGWFNNLALKMVSTLAVISVTSICTAVGTAYHFMGETNTRLAVLETEFKNVTRQLEERVTQNDRKANAHEQQIVALRKGQMLQGREIQEAAKVVEEQEPDKRERIGAKRGDER